MSSRLKDIPRLARDGKNLNSVMDGVLEALQTFRGYRGDLLDKALTPRDFAPGVLGGLTSGGIGAGGITIIGGGVGGPGTPYEPDLTPPPTATFPAGRLITAGIASIFIESDPQTYTQGHGHDRTIVYGAKWPSSDPSAPTFSEAVELFSFQGTFGAYPSDPATRWCVWIKWKSNDGVLSVDPAGGTNGQQATTGQDVALLLEALTGEITESQLYGALNTRISLIDAADSVAGSVSNKVKAETDARVAALALEAGYRVDGDATTLGSAQTYTQTWAYSKSATDSAIAASGSSLTTAFGIADAATLTSAQTYVGTYAYSKSTVDSAFSSLDSTLRTAFATADSATLASANAFTYSRAAIDSSIASSASTLTTAFNNADAATLASANSFTYSRSAIDGAISSSASSLTAAYASADSTASAATLSAADAAAASRDSVVLASANAYTYSQATIDGAISSSASTLTAAYTSAISTERTSTLSAADAAAAARDSTVLSTAAAYTYSRATIDSAIASSASTLTANYGSAISSAVSTEASARAALDGSVQALYTVRAQVSAGGSTMVGGFGLAATSTSGGGSTIDFGVIANRFYVGAPNDGSAPGIGNALPFIIQASATTINGVAVPAGVYMDEAFIRNGTIANAKIGNAAIDDAKVANLSAAKLTVGDGTVGGNLKSSSYTGGSGGTPGAGWLLTPAGNAYFNNAVVYGTVYASAGVFAGSLSAATGTFSGSLSAASGSFTGTLSGADITGATGTFSGGLNVSSGGSSRMEITSSRIKIFNSGVERVRIGDLS